MISLDTSLSSLRRVLDLGTEEAAIVLEKRCSLTEVLAARRSIRIAESFEALTPVPRELF